MTRRGEADIADRYGSRTLHALLEISRLTEVGARFVERGEDWYAGDPDGVPALACESLIIKMGENVSRVSPEFQRDHPHVPWRVIKGMRNRLTHYDEATDYQVVWDTLTSDFPTVERLVHDVLGENIVDRSSARPRQAWPGSHDGGTSRIYVDMVGDLFHAGHVELLRAAKARGGWLVVGVLSDDTAAAYKRPPITTLAERVAVIQACRYVDEVVPDAPFTVDDEFLAEYEIARVVHGDDLTPEGAETVYGAAAAAGRLEIVARTSGISTTDLIRRVISAHAAGDLG